MYNLNTNVWNHRTENLISRQTLSAGTILLMYVAGRRLHYIADKCSQNSLQPHLSTWSDVLLEVQKSAVPCKSLKIMESTQGASEVQATK